MVETPGTKSAKTNKMDTYKISFEIDNLDKSTYDKIMGELKDISKITNIKTDALPAPQADDKIMIAFERYIRSENTYPKMWWSDEKIAQFEEDRSFRDKVYDANKIDLGFSEAYEFAKIETLKKIVKETLEGKYGISNK